MRFKYLHYFVNTSILWEVLLFECRLHPITYQQTLEALNQNEVTVGMWKRVLNIRLCKPFTFLNLSLNSDNTNGFVHKCSKDVITSISFGIHSFTFTTVWNVEIQNTIGAKDTIFEYSISL